MTRVLLMFLGGNENGFLSGEEADAGIADDILRDGFFVGEVL